MVETAALHGYAGASVVRVCKHAGVSRATFYQHFQDREHCFGLAYEGVVRRFRETVRTAPLGPGGRAGGRVLGVVDRLLQLGAADPAATKLILVEALGASTAIRKEHERLIGNAEMATARYLRSTAGDAETLNIPATALLGGVAGVMAMRLVKREAQALPALALGLRVWLASYLVPPAPGGSAPGRWEELGRAIPPARPECREGPALLPRGRNAISPRVAAVAQRERIVDATARLAETRGYAGVTVADICAEARISRRAFYSNFSGKRDVLLTSQTIGLQASMAAAAPEYSLGHSWPDRGWRGMKAFLGYLAANPALAYLGIVEIYAAGEEALLREQEYRAAYTLFLADGYRQSQAAERLPTLCSEAISGAIHALVRRELAAGRAAQLPRLLPQCAYVVLAPFIGPAEAWRYVQERASAASAAA